TASAVGAAGLLAYAVWGQADPPLGGG
ncbi:MAG: hypothetical protein XU14_C0083G0013, partial [Armatimonadetes bacterium CSP1-3]